MGEHLENSPLLEAICQVTFADARWDDTTIGAVRAGLSDEFAQQEAIVQEEVQASWGPHGLQPVLKHTPRWQLKRADGAAMVQLSPSVLVINQLRPYKSWEVYEQLITRTLKKYVAATGFKSAQRLGLRYINHLPTVETTRVRDVLTTRPNLVGVLERAMTSFYQRYDLAQDDIDAQLVHQTGTAIANGVHGLILDLDLSSRQPLDISVEATARAWFNQAHDRIEEAFRASITVAHMKRLRGEA